ncbi:carboxymuconolactone decarboxylase family protein [Streptoalloteichus hindustanus]|uniref:Carboxymuconolactone decarboxylase family protein n=1 Tax=Streptoalloteichus hindustanus TaxID=2017 RepID=A0A1M5GM28_STRHI|nr:carboxymuconolactone decarboxylase family protein [Streptoalloteichus hindustanus]SHG04718.1 Carboxymuconolactone decarboxylase family protein [Streptoalloteichus hindustanus]
MSLDELRQRGRETFATLIPNGEERLDRLYLTAPALGELTVSTVYGYLHHRPAFDPRTREAVALAAVMASGTTETPLAIHIRTGLASGLAPAEVVEVLVQTAAFSGYPRAVQALARVEEVLGEAGSPLPAFPAPREVLLLLIERLRAEGRGGTAWRDSTVDTDERDYLDEPEGGNSAELLEPEFGDDRALAELRDMAVAGLHVQVRTTSAHTAIALFNGQSDRPSAVVHATMHAGRVVELVCLRPTA